MRGRAVSVRSDEQNIIAARNRELPLRFASHESCILHTTHFDDCGCLSAAKDAEIAKLREALKDAVDLLDGPAWDHLRGEHAKIVKLREILEGEG